MSNVLFILTSHDRMLNDDPTGVWLEEFALPWQRLTNAGHRVTVSSIRGGQVPIDPNSEPEAEQREQWQKAIAELQSTPAFDSLDAEGGGGGPRDGL